MRACVRACALEKYDSRLVWFGRLGRSLRTQPCVCCAEKAGACRFAWVQEILGWGNYFLHCQHHEMMMMMMMAMAYRWIGLFPPYCRVSR
jgi:hypothetical protein